MVVLPAPSGLQLLPPPHPVRGDPLGHSIPACRLGHVLSIKCRGWSLPSKPGLSTSEWKLSYCFWSERQTHPVLAVVPLPTPWPEPIPGSWWHSLPGVRTFPEGLTTSTRSSRSRAPRCWPFKFCSRACRFALFLYEEAGGFLVLRYIP